MSSSLPLEIGETLQSLSINRNPSPTHDINPSTAASEKVPVTLDETTLDAESYSSSLDGSNIDDEEEYSYSVIRPTRRRQSLPPLPDLRFEQSYLASIAGAETYQMVAYITIRDQVILPLLQGTMWTLALQGWRHWNRGTKLSGKNAGARIRRWWWRVNNWPLDQSASSIISSMRCNRVLAEIERVYNGAMGRKVEDHGRDGCDRFTRLFFYSRDGTATWPEFGTVDMFFAAPPVTRTLTALTFGISVAYYAGLVPHIYNWIFFHYSLIFKFPPQLWRFATCFMLTGERFSILMDPYYMYTYGKKCETGSSKFTKPGDFFFYLVFVCLALLGINHAFWGEAYILTSALYTAFAYTATQDEGGQTRIFILDIPTRALPLALCFMTFVSTGSLHFALIQATGILVAHLYDFLTRLYPKFGGGVNILATPTFVRRWFEPKVASVSHKSHGTSFQPAAPRTAASGSTAPGGVLPESWKSRGSGHRLGGDL
ncbi:hypothetical protein V500_05535 [Pseudogymnoascus sp. VKM F-4518 (FW-2643)]|nr:hypothetical protein V500_05535 [Pseudogymnoascus sp. VKM F-4518 (FW-2643)]